MIGLKRKQKKVFLRYEYNCKIKPECACKEPSTCNCKCELCTRRGETIDGYVSGESNMSGMSSVVDNDESSSDDEEPF